MVKQMYTLHWQCDVRNYGHDYMISCVAQTAHSTRAFATWMDISKREFDEAKPAVQALFLAEVCGALLCYMEEGMKAPPAPADVPCHPAFTNARRQPHETLQ